MTKTVSESIVERDGRKFKQTRTKYVGQKGPIKRLQWKKFGIAVGVPYHDTTELGADVEMERPATDPQGDEWIPNGEILMSAKQLGWTDREVDRLFKSSNPYKTFADMWEKKCKESMNLAVFRYNEEQRKKAAAAAEAAGKSMEPVSEPEPNVDTSKPMGLQERMRLRRQKAATKASSTTGSTGNLADRLRLKKEAREDSAKKSTLFLENIPTDYDESMIKSYIQDIRHRRVNVVRRENEYGVRDSVGKAFIECVSQEEAQKCIDLLHGARWESCIISVTFSKPKPKPDDRRGRGRGGAQRGRGSMRTFARGRRF